MTPAEQDAKFLAIFEKSNRLLLELGWMLPGAMQTHEVQRVEQLLDQYQAAKASGHADKPLKAVRDLMIRHVHAPVNRAHMIFRMAQQPSTRRVAHHAEAATLHYYKREYFSCVLTLLPALEGMLSTRLGWTAASGDRLPSFEKLRRSISDSKPVDPFLARRYALHRDALTAYMGRWVLSPHNNMAVDVSYLNRHYALHCMGDGCFYTSTDCHRLFTFLDVYLDFLGYENRIGLYAFPPEDDYISARAEHYLVLMAGKVTLLASQSTDLAFLSSHASFTLETEPLDWEEIVEKKLREDAERIALILSQEAPDRSVPNSNDP